MRGRQVFMESLIAHGVDRIFGNPGTTESPLLDSLGAYPSIRYVTALQESIAMAAASFYAQASGKTGIVSLHVAPGLGNAMGMLYCAMRANSPVIVTAGQQDTRMRLSDPVLGHDLVAMAEPLTKWSVQVERADEMAPILRRAFKVANDGPAGPVFIGLPINVMEEETSVAPVTAGMLHRKPEVAHAAIGAMAELIANAQRPAIVCGDDVARAGAIPALVKLAETMGASVWCEGLHMLNAFPTAHASARLGLPLDTGLVRKLLGDADLVLLAGGPFFEDVWFAAGSPFPAGARVLQIEESPARLGYNHRLEQGAVGDLKAAFERLGLALDAAPAAFKAAAAKRNAALAALKEREIAGQKERAQKSWEREPASMPRAMAEIRDALPKGTIVVDETITASIDLARTFDFMGPRDYFSGRGGGIGQGLAGAIGVQVAMPDKPVVCISGDGSAMYSIQALWTAAHLDLPIVFVILVNREYRVLKHNIDVYRMRFGIASQEPYAHMDLGHPNLGFVEMAAGMGIAGTRVMQPEGIKAAIAAAFKTKRPHLVEVAIEAKR